MSVTESEQELMNEYRRWCDAWNNQDLDTVFEIQGESVGYGYRTQNIRINPNPDAKRSTREWFSTLKSIQMVSEEENFRVIGHTGIVWGSFSEHIVEHDGTNRIVFGRYTMTWVKKDGKWEILMFHRDNIFNR